MFYLTGRAHSDNLNLYPLKERSSVPRKKVMVVDDAPDNALLLEVTLKDVDYDVVILETGVGIMEALKVHRPDLILLDIMLPEKGGIEICQEIRASDGEFKNIPVIAVSAKARKEDIDLGLAAGANEYITKPFDPFYILERVNSFLGHA